MEEGRGPLRVSLQDLRPLADAIDHLGEEPIASGDAMPLPPPPPTGDGLTVTFSAPLRPSRQADPVSGEEMTAAAEFANSPVTGNFPEETVVGKGPAADPDAMIIADRYLVEETIGEGGMGKVFRVRHRRLGKSFALKLMQTEFSENPRARDLFYREARLASSLAHPNIVSVIDFGEDPKLGAFMVMELLEGESLAAKLHDEGKFTMRTVCDLTLQVAEALNYIHKRQIVHCDIKPDNILLTSPPAGERRKFIIKLLDFGLARFGSPSGRSSQVIDGTPEYMAPERIQGCTPQASMDIYGLGVLAYELVTGQPPFLGPMGQVLYDHVNTPVPPIKSHGKEPIDERAEALILKSLAKDPKDRQKDMAAFVYEMRTLMDMLGFGRRRGAAPAVKAVVADPAQKRARGAALGYDLSPLPMAGLNVDGQIMVANRAFVQFVTGDATTQIEATNIHTTRFLEVHPGLSADLRKVHVSAEPLQRVLQLAMDDTPIRLMLWMIPGTAEAGEIQLAVHALEG
ncbi:MAG TPA: serine/threonine-protein kinase [Kofleriaceae bacterium]|nr:serine/threonine-protein kinase [Kofleriaceae bacterium]